MSTLLLALLAVGAPPPAAAPVYSATGYAVTASTDAQNRDVATARLQWRDRVRVALRTQAQADRDGQIPALGRLFELALQLDGETRLSPTERSRLFDKLHRRIVRVAGEVRKRMTQSAQFLARVDDQHATPPRPHRIAQIESHRRVLAQFDDFANQFDAAEGGNGHGAAFAEFLQQVVAPEAWEPNGGAGRVALFQQGAGGGNGGGGSNSLVELIEKVVDPESWEVNGGPGTIAVFGQ